MPAAQVLVWIIRGGGAIADDVEVDNGDDNMEEDSGVEEIGMEDSEVEDSDGELLSDDEVFIMFSDTKPDQTWKLQG